MKRKLLTVFSMVFVLTGVIFILTSCDSIGNGTNGYVSQEVAEKEFGQEETSKEPDDNHVATFIDKNNDISNDEDEDEDEDEKNETGSTTTEYN